MLKIAICDDERLEREKIRSILAATEIQWNAEFCISQFSSGEKLLASLKEISYDVILLDIKMNGMDGVEVARRLKMLGTESLIIFISGYDAQLKELFGYRIIAFLDKPIEKETLEQPLREAQKIIKDREKLFSYKQNGEMKYVPSKDIMYFEVERNYINIYTKTERIRYKATLSEVWASIEKWEEFIKPNQSCICNLEHVSLKSNEVILLTKDKKFSIGRNCKENTLTRYFDYIGRRSS